MIQDEALSRDPPTRATPHNHPASSTDGARQFHTTWNTSRGDDWTSEVLWAGWRFYTMEALTGPPGLDWTPGTFHPPLGALPVSDPALEYPKARGRQSLPPGMRPELPQGELKPCQCAPCKRRRGELQ